MSSFRAGRRPLALTIPLDGFLKFNIGTSFFLSRFPTYIAGLLWDSNFYIFTDFAKYFCVYSTTKTEYLAIRETFLLVISSLWVFSSFFFFFPRVITQSLFLGFINLVLILEHSNPLVLLSLVSPFNLLSLLIFYTFRENNYKVNLLAHVRVYGRQCNYW